ncbi:MAG: hypothetical protein RRA94_04605 [Bacteroidota bacterium]|nr:hypothetical protein [Bacteroidota bacterium]
MHLHVSISTADLLDGLLKGNLDERQTDVLIDRTVQQARKYIHWLIWHRGYQLGPTGLSVDDLAYDLIAELVSELDGEMLGRLRHAISELTEVSDASYDVESAFIAVVNRNVRFNIARLFVDLNPVHARLLRALRRYAQASDEIRRIDSFGGFWYARAGDALLERPPMPLEILRTGVLRFSENGNPVRAVLDACLVHLGDQDTWRRAVLEHDVIELTVTLLKLHHAVIDQQFAVDAGHGDTEIAGAALTESLEDARSWVEERYVRTGKLSPGEADAMLDAVLLYIEDLLRKDVLGHVSYLRQTMPGLTQQRYRESYRNVYEYILRSIFTRARERLQ